MSSVTSKTCSHASSLPKKKSFGAKQVTFLQHLFGFCHYDVILVGFFFRFAGSAKNIPASSVEGLSASALVCVITAVCLMSPVVSGTFG